MTELPSRRLVLKLLAAAPIALLAVSNVAQASADAEAYVKGIGKDVVALANGGLRGKSLRGRFASLLGRYVNLRTIAASSLGTYRSKMPAGDKEKFNQLVTTYAAALFVYYVDKFKGSDFEIASVTTQGSFTVVKSHIVKASGGSEQVVWYLAGKGGNFQVVDLSILGVRLSIAMRDAFSRELKKSKGDFESLYSFLREAETW
jgi:ABC-type transporter MlaC component